MIYVILACIVNCTDFYQKNLETELLSKLPDAYKDLEFLSIPIKMVKFVIDADLYIMPSDSKILLRSVIQYIENQEVPLIVFDKGTNEKKIFYTEPPNEIYIESLEAVIKSQNMFKKIGLIHSSDAYSLEAVKLLRERGHLFVTASLGKNSNQIMVTELISKFFKSQGITDYLVIVEKRLCSKVEQGFADAKLNKKWNIILYGKECAGQLNKEGSLFIAPSKFEPTGKTYDCNLNGTYVYLNTLDSKKFSKYQISNKFKKIKSSFDYSLINIQASKNTLVGEIRNGDVKIVSGILYPSGLSTREILDRVPIRISANTGVTNPLGYPHAYQNAKYHQGTYFAVDKVRKTNSNFANFDLQLFDNITCGTNYFEYNYSKDCYLKIKDELGIAFIPSYYDTTADTVNQFEDIGIKIPIIAGMGEVLERINTTIIKNFFRLVMPPIKCVNHYYNVWRKNSWDKLIVFYTDDTWGEGFYSYYKALENSGLLTIVNKEKYRKISSAYRPEMLDDIKENIKNALESGCNLISILMPDPVLYYFIESLSQYGVEYGEFIISNALPHAQDAGRAEDANFELRKKLLHGSFLSHNSFGDSEYADKIRAEFKKSGYDSHTPEYYIDAVFTIAKTIEFLLNQGRDYEDSDIFIDALLKIKFMGVTGKISFDSENHLKNSYTCNIYNIYYDSEIKDYVMKHVVKIDPISNLYLLSIKGAVWYKNIIKYPNMKSSYYSCPYFTQNIVKSQVSSTNELSINLTTLVTLIFLSIFLLFKIKIEEIKPLARVSFIRVMDVIQMALIIIEPLQLISIGPSFERINKTLSYLLNIISMNAIKLFSLRDQGYWVVYFLTLGVSYFWLILIVLSTKKFKSVLKSYQLKIIELKNFMVPLIINYLLIPILFNSVSVISCQYSEKRNLNIAFLDNDCNFQCWTSTHYAYIIFSVLLVIILSQLAIIYRLDIENSSLNFNIQSNGKFLILKNMASIIMIFHGNNIKARSELAFAIIFLIIMTFIFCLAFKWSPYNYDRINLWIKVVLACIIWHSIACIVDLSMDLAEITLSVIYFTGWAVLIFLGLSLHLKLPPSLLIFKKGRTIIQMIRLAFRLGYFESLNPNIIRKKSLRNRRRFK